MVNFPLEVTVVTVIVLEDLFKFLACKQHKELSKQTVGKMFSLNEFFLVHWLMYYSHFLNLTLWQQECKLNNMRLFSYRFFFFWYFLVGWFSTSSIPHLSFYDAWMYCEGEYICSGQGYNNQVSIGLTSSTSATARIRQECLLCFYCSAYK